MSSLSLSQLGVFAPESLFQNLNLTIMDGARVGVVAGNGGGKTTLLRCVAGLCEPSEGAVSYARGLRLGFVPQDVPASLFDQSLFACVQEALPCDQRMDAWRVDMLLASFSFPQELHRRQIRALSGGWQKLALIARAFAFEPEALLLDEPTNHLDLSKIQFLERWLLENAARLPMLIVSHDRRFLDVCTTQTLFLRPSVSKLYAHPYSLAKKLLLDDDAVDQAKLEQGTKEAHRLRRSAGELKNIGINCHSDKALKKSKQIAARAAEIENNLREPHKERSGQIKLLSRETYARVLLSFDEVVVREPNGAALFNTGKMKVFQGDRIILSGPNGAGKSQMIKLIHKALSLSSGVQGVQFSPSVVMGYADQQMSQLPIDQTPFDLITNRFHLGDQCSRTLLAGAGFPVDRQCCLLKSFSLGQRARLGMLVLRLTKPNFYLLDEPTNHVDIPGQERLEAEILAQDATCFLVSHDRLFVKAIGTRIWHIQKGKLVEPPFEKEYGEL